MRIDRTRSDDGFFGKAFDRGINILQVVVIVGGGFYFAGQMSGRIDSVTTMISNIRDDVRNLTQRVDGIVSHR